MVLCIPKQACSCGNQYNINRFTFSRLHNILWRVMSLLTREFQLHQKVLNIHFYMVVVAIRMCLHVHQILTYIMQILQQNGNICNVVNIFTLSLPALWHYSVLIIQYIKPKREVYLLHARVITIIYLNPKPRYKRR